MGAPSLPLRGVYRIRNTDNGRTYIGHSVDIDRRYAFHIATLRGRRHHNVRMMEDWREGAFVLEVIEEVDETASLIGREARHIRAERPYYNLGYPNAFEWDLTLSHRITLPTQAWEFLAEYGDGLPADGILRLIGEHHGRLHDSLSAPTAPSAMTGPKRPGDGSDTEWTRRTRRAAPAARLGHPGAWERPSGAPIRSAMTDGSPPPASS